MNNQNSSHINKKRAAVTQLLNAIDDLKSLERFEIALDLSNNMNNGTREPGNGEEIEFGDFAGANKNLTVTDIINVTNTLHVIENALEGGHFTNLYKLKN